MDFFKGDVAGALDLWPSRTMQEVVAHPDRIDDALLLGTATPHRSGLQVLAQPHDLAEAVQVGTPEVDRLVSAARSAFERCVFDCGSRMDEVAAATALRADLVVIVASPEVAALRNAGRSLDLLRGLGVPNARLRLVVTRLPRRSPVSLDDATRHLGFRIAATIVRNDDVCARADATGQTLKEVDPRADVTRDLGALWSRLTGAAPEPAAAPGWGFLRVLRG
jgi:pilus assembly protein CpaE